MDIGGTSCDICLIKDYLADWTVESSIGGLPIRSPMIDVKSIGAGGGSIIWVDSGGALRVGPKSTGSDPGPVCYGKGGQQPAITDAHLIAGAVHPKSFADKGIKIDFKAAQTALKELGRTIGLSAEEVATGAIEVMNHSIAHAIRVAAMGELGGFAMVAFGGAGPLHACPVAEQLGIDRILLPDFAGVFSANGAALADYRYDFVQGHPKRMDEVNESELEDIFKRLVKMGEMKFKELPSLENRIDRSVELRYLGQSFEINVPVADKGSSGLNKQDILQRFHRLHEENYGYSDTREPVELVNVRISCFAMTPKPKLARSRYEPFQISNAETADILAPGKRVRISHAVIDRAQLKPKERFFGPCLILSRNSTTLVSDGWSGSMDEDGTIELLKGDMQ